MDFPDWQAGPSPSPTPPPQPQAAQPVQQPQSMPMQMQPTPTMNQGQEPQQGWQQQQQPQPGSFGQPGQQQLGGPGFQQQMTAGVAGALGMNQAVVGAVTERFIQDAGVGKFTGWFPTFFVSLQALFNVGHNFVMRKILLLLCPFISSRGAPQQWGDASPSPQPGQSGLGLKMDVEEPDLYIPLMGYVTYVLAYGIQRGTLSEFKPEVLSGTASFAFVLLILEVGVAKIGFYIAGSPVSTFDIFANCGYKYVHVMFMVMLRIVTSSAMIYYPVFLYLSACAAYATRRFMLHFQQSQLRNQYGVQPSGLHTHIILGLAIAQIPLCWLLTPWGAK